MIAREPRYEDDTYEREPEDDIERADRACEQSLLDAADSGLEMDDMRIEKDEWVPTAAEFQRMVREKQAEIVREDGGWKPAPQPAGGDGVFVQPLNMRELRELGSAVSRLMFELKRREEWLRMEHEAAKRMIAVLQTPVKDMDLSEFEVTS